jgi:hypothetical protein
MQPLEHAHNAVMPFRVLRAVDDHDVTRRRQRRYGMRVHVDYFHIAAVDAVKCCRVDRSRGQQERQRTSLKCLRDNHRCTSDV